MDIAWNFFKTNWDGFLVLGALFLMCSLIALLTRAYLKMTPVAKHRSVKLPTVSIRTLDLEPYYRVGSDSREVMLRVLIEDLNKVASRHPGLLSTQIRISSLQAHLNVTLNSISSKSEKWRFILYHADLFIDYFLFAYRNFEPLKKNDSVLSKIILSGRDNLYAISGAYIEDNKDGFESDQSFTHFADFIEKNKITDKKVIAMFDRYLNQNIVELDFKPLK